MKSGQAQKKKYIHHNQLLFLLKTIQEDSTISNIGKSSQDSDNESRSGTSASLNRSQDSENETTSRIRPTTSLTQSRKKRLNPVDVEILKALQSHEPRLDEFKDDDKAF